LWIRREPVKCLDEPAVHSRFREDIEVPHQKRAIAEDIEQSRSGAATSGVGGPEIFLREVERHAISARIHRNGIVKMSEPFPGIDVGVAARD
jgi:hypothetical protein